MVEERFLPPFFILISWRIDLYSQINAINNEFLQFLDLANKNIL